MSQIPMRVELTEFCEDFSSTLKPFSDALDKSIVSLYDLPEPNNLRRVLSELVDNQHRLKILRDKARQQHAYLLIFGPLKSGKSTLMNAIAGSYVSEVSSLPAYPCLVYVHESNERKFSYTRFNGEEVFFHSSPELKDHLEQAHTELAAELRKADGENRSFNPSIDFPEAIRRVDFTMPAPNLQQSGTILVDTPGLYTKMRYNYDQLTRDFRNNAACAVFVVKTDNLFFEQVFEEFTDLLGVFSRVFLVINIDSTKRDLAPEGELEPALESRDPKRIVEAFENLTVSAQLRDAIDSGQLRIYLIDLLRTATKSLRGEPIETLEPETEPDVEPGAIEDEPSASVDEIKAPEDQAMHAIDDDSEEPKDFDVSFNLEMSGDEDDENVTEPLETATPSHRLTGDAQDALAETKGEEPVLRQPSGPKVGFDLFLNDLTEYLNSSDYIIEFMADSIRQADAIAKEVKSELGSPSIQQFKEDREALKQKAENAKNLVNRIDALKEQNFDEPLSKLTKDLTATTESETETAVSEAKQKLLQQVRAWFEHDESLADLVKQTILPKVRGLVEDLRARELESIRSTCRTRNSGLRLSAELVGRLHQLDMTFDDIYPAFDKEVSEQLEGSQELPKFSVKQSSIPVRKGLMDWVLFRTPNRIRRKLLGETDPSEARIPPTTKQKRLGEEARAHLQKTVEDFIDSAVSTTVTYPLQNTLESYRDFYKTSVKGRLDRKQRHLKTERDDYLRIYNAQVSVGESLESLEEACKSLVGRNKTLHEQYVGERQSIKPAFTDLEEEPEMEETAATPLAEDFEPAETPEKLGEGDLNSLAEEKKKLLKRRKVAKREQRKKRRTRPGSLKRLTRSGFRVPEDNRGGQRQGS